MANVWTKARRKKLSLAMKASVAAKRSRIDSALTQAHEANKAPIDMSTAQAPALDLRRVEQFHYRRGLLVALDSIIRELRDSY